MAQVIVKFIVRDMLAVWPLFLRTTLNLVVAKELRFLDPVKAGHSRWVDLGDGHQAEVRTLATRPPLFYVSGFLSAPEADELILEAKMGEMLSSIAQGSEPARGIQTFRAFDRDRNGFLDQFELARLLNKVFLIANHDHELFMLHHNLPMPEISEFVFRTIDFPKYRDWIAQTCPHKMQRYSDQVWLRYSFVCYNCPGTMATITVASADVAMAKAWPRPQMQQRPWR